ncbi:unnamed protein product [Amoebophrya sp. A25]|nr:unnamed protein product [Amoebophrya sp. A25]|eukprot:GSA25T00018849001.1
MPRLRDGFEYPMPKTLHEGVRGGLSVMAGPSRDQVIKTTPMMTPGPTRYNVNHGAVHGQIKCTTQWSKEAPRFKDGTGPIQKSDSRSYTPLQPSTAPKWSVPKGKGHTIPRIQTCGADAFYNVKKDYVDCAFIGSDGNGALVQGGVQMLGTGVVKIADLKKRVKSEARVKNYPAKPGPGTYEDQKDAVLDRVPKWTQTKSNLDKVRFPGSFVQAKKWMPPPGIYEADDVVKKGKNCNGARLEQQLGHASSFRTGAD